MYEIKENEIIALSSEDTKKVSNTVYTEDAHNPDVHYLAFDRQLFGFSPLGSYLIKLDQDVMAKSEELIQNLENRQEICSLFPRLKLSLYPITKTTGKFSDYIIDVANIDCHFKDILYLNDEVYKTKILFVDPGHHADNWRANLGLIEKKLQWLLANSKVLEHVYLLD